MERSKKPVSFIATDRADEAQAFYRDTLGLALCETTPFALVFDDQGHVLRVQIVSDLRPAQFTAHGWQVENLVGEIEKLRAKAVRFLQFDQLPQDALGIWTTPDGSKIAWFKDPSGNILSLTEHAKP